MFPYLLGGGMFTLSLTIGLKDQGVVGRSPGEFYCNMTNTLPCVTFFLPCVSLSNSILIPREKMSAIMVTVIMIICVCLDVYICVVLHRHRSLLVIGDLQASLATVIRVLVFSAFSVVGVV